MFIILEKMSVILKSIIKVQNYLFIFLRGGGGAFFQIFIGCEILHKVRSSIIISTIAFRLVLKVKRHDGHAMVIMNHLYIIIKNI